MEYFPKIFFWLLSVAIVGYLVPILIYRILEARKHGLHWIEDDPEDEAEWQQWSRKHGAK